MGQRPGRSSFSSPHFPIRMTQQATFVERMRDLRDAAERLKEIAILALIELARFSHSQRQDRKESWPCMRPEEVDESLH